MQPSAPSPDGVYQAVLSGAASDTGARNGKPPRPVHTLRAWVADAPEAAVGGIEGAGGAGRRPVVRAASARTCGTPSGCRAAHNVATRTPFEGWQLALQLAALILWLREPAP
ncbi:hypothetical protein GCM10017667_39070 [Streptomyces filamentosus]|uniref:Uncharacterized protein n=1 Tax=Streptomyces filamentosus TaxID=67294 RepID=A0A919BP87_STRFL|nr:hypothetical protein GCM10017667_39070 [Streptomyces filamentosus]